MYLDTSVAVKLFVPEADSEECELAVTGMELFSSELLYGELRSALLQKEHGGHISPEARERVWSCVEDVLANGTLRLIPLNGFLVREAVEVMDQVHPQIRLRTLDAIHLATYLSVDAGPLFSRDRRMVEAAQKLGIAVVGA